MRPMRRGASLSAALVFLTGCGGCGSEAPPGADAGPAAAVEPGWRDSVSLVDELRRCDIEHRGLLIDLGARTLPGRMAWAIDPPGGVVNAEHDGATWSRIYERQVTFSFYLPKVTPIFVAMRGVGRDSTRVTVSVDGYGLSTVRLAKDQIQVAESQATRLPLDAGLHGVTLRFRGHKSVDSEPFAELDWVRIGVPDDHLKRTYGAPTMEDVLDPAAELAGVPHRAISVRAPSTIRCAVRVPPHGKLRAAVGMNGSGKAKAAVLVRRDGEEAAVLEKVEVTGGEGAAWQDVEVSLHRFAGQIVDVELTALETTGTGRLLFGDPAVVVPDIEPRDTPDAKVAVVVVLGGVERRDLPPWSEIETPHLPTLNELARDATVFQDHRANSTLVNTVVASLITGRAPSYHRLADPGARLPEGVVTLGKLARDASVRAAMFTGVPTTFEPFGFGTDWDKFETYPPNEGRPPSAPFEDAATWLSDTKEQNEARPMLAVLHVAGGHPPWEITPPEAAKLPPEDYAGYLSPRRGAQLIAKLQGRHSRLGEADRQRLDALFATGLARQDRALGNLIRRLRDDNRWDSTLFIVTGDVASGRRTLFADGAPMDEELLLTPLYVHFPTGAHAGVSVEDATEVYDVSHTVLDALGIEASAELLGRDLAGIAGSVDYDLDRVRLAVTDRKHSLRWGDFVLLAEEAERPSLCQLSVDPTCAYDRRHLYPSIAQAMYRRLVRWEDASPFERQPLTLEAEGAAMLDVWGAY